MLSGEPNSSTILTQIPQDSVTSRTVATGGTFWQLFDSRDAVETEVSTAFQSLANTSANRLSIPNHLYELKDTPHTAYVLLQWSTDTVMTSLNLSTTFQLSPEAQKHLNDTDPKEWYAAFGHQFIESYTEKCTMSALWKISLTNHEGVNAEESFYALRLRLQKYFLSPRTVAEVCKFFSKTTSQDMQNTVLIMGYHDEFTNKLKTLGYEAAGTAQEYLTREALARSKIRTSLTVRPWNNLDFDWSKVEPKVELSNGMKEVLQKGAEEKVSLPAPEEFFVLKRQKAAQLLLLLQLRESSDDELRRLRSYGERLDAMLERDHLDDNGAMKPGVKKRLVNFGEELEGDLAKIKSGQAIAGKS